MDHLTQPAGADPGTVARWQLVRGGGSPARAEASGGISSRAFPGWQGVGSLVPRRGEPWSSPGRSPILPGEGRPRWPDSNGASRPVPRARWAARPASRKPVTVGRHHRRADPRPAELPRPAHRPVGRGCPPSGRRTDGAPRLDAKVAVAARRPAGARDADSGRRGRSLQIEALLGTGPSGPLG